MWHRGTQPVDQEFRDFSPMDQQHRSPHQQHRGYPMMDQQQSGPPPVDQQQRPPPLINQHRGPLQMDQKHRGPLLMNTQLRGPPLMNCERMDYPAMDQQHSGPPQKNQQDYRDPLLMDQQHRCPPNLGQQHRESPPMSQWRRSPSLMDPHHGGPPMDPQDYHQNALEPPSNHLLEAPQQYQRRPILMNPPEQKGNTEHNRSELFQPGIEDDRLHHNNQEEHQQNQQHQDINVPLQYDDMATINPTIGQQHRESPPMSQWRRSPSLMNPHHGGPPMDPQDYHQNTLEPPSNHSQEAPQQRQRRTLLMNPPDQEGNTEHNRSELFQPGMEHDINQEEHKQNQLHEDINVPMRYDDMTTINQQEDGTDTWQGPNITTQQPNSEQNDVQQTHSDMNQEDSHQNSQDSQHLLTSENVQERDTGIKQDEVSTIKDLQELERQQELEELEAKRLYCTVCDVRFEKEGQFWIHNRGLAHYQKVESKEREKNREEGGNEDKDCGNNEPEWSYCEPCDMNFYSEGSYLVHIKTASHLVCQKDAEQFELPTVHKRPDWTAAHEKDLTPYDIGNPNTHLFYCEICQVTCTGPKSFTAHTEGQKHAKKIQQKEAAYKVKQMQINPVKAKRKRGSVVEMEIKRCSLPLIGVDYMTEFQKENFEQESRFVCDLCQSKMDPRQVILHLTGLKHRTKYFKYHAGQYHTNVCYAKAKSDKSFLAEKYAVRIEKEEGRRDIRVRIQLEPFSSGTSSGTADQGQERFEDIPVENVRDVKDLPGMKSSDVLNKYKQFSQSDDEEDDDQIKKKYDVGENTHPSASAARNDGKRSPSPSATGRPLSATDRPRSATDRPSSATDRPPSASTVDQARDIRHDEYQRTDYQGRDYDRSDYYRDYDRNRYTATEASKNSRESLPRQNYDSPYDRGRNPYDRDPSSRSSDPYYSRDSQYGYRDPYGDSYNRDRYSRDLYSSSDPYSRDRGYGRDPYARYSSYDDRYRDPYYRDVYSRDPYGKDPYATDGRPSATDGRPAATDGRPAATSNKSVNPYERPPPEHYNIKKDAKDQGSRYRDPYYRDVYSRDPYGRDPYATDGRPAATDDRPAATDDRPAATDGRPAATDGRPAATSNKSDIKREDMTKALKAVEDMLDEFKTKKFAADESKRAAEVSQTPASSKVADEKKEELHQASSKAATLLSQLGQCVVDNENDASIALTMSNALTQALLEYRMKHISPSMQSSEHVKEYMASLSQAAKDIEYGGNNTLPTSFYEFPKTLALADDTPGAFGTSDVKSIPGLGDSSNRNVYNTAPSGSESYAGYKLDLSNINANGTSFQQTGVTQSSSESYAGYELNQGNPSVSELGMLANAYTANESNIEAYSSSQSRPPTTSVLDSANTIYQAYSQMNSSLGDPLTDMLRDVVQTAISTITTGQPPLPPPSYQPAPPPPLPSRDSPPPPPPPGNEGVPVKRTRRK